MCNIIIFHCFGRNNCPKTVGGAATLKGTQATKKHEELIAPEVREAGDWKT